VPCANSNAFRPPASYAIIRPLVNAQILKAKIFSSMKTTKIMHHKRAKKAGSS
jgi:hypothetical protein